MKNLILQVTLLVTTLAFSQQEASVWYFGQNAGLKFQNDGSVVPLSDGVLNTEEGCSSIADANGNLLFYTDGRTVWDRNHVVMPNGSFADGTELFGDPSSTQSGIIVPNPNDTNSYYIFTLDEPHHQNAAVYPGSFSGNYAETDSGSVPLNDDGLNNGFNYSIVDLTVSGSNGSVGNVISRNNHLITYDTNPSGEEIKYKCSEKVTAIKNEADNSYWVITHFINNFYAFKVTATGVNPTPVISTVGSNQNLLGYRRNALGYLKASPDGQKLAIAHQQNVTVAGQSCYGCGSVQLFDFDATTGIVSNPINVMPNVQAYGVEFSQNSKKLYATYRVATTPTMELSQFDLLSADVPNSKVILYDLQNYLFALQLAPNNKIYCATGYANSLGVINNPDATGLACNYIQIGQPLATGKTVKLGLPPFITSFFNASFTTQNLCLGSNATFTINSSLPILSATWDFGDSSPISNAISPVHNYATAGTYTVTLTATSISGTSTRSKAITISEPPIIANTITNQTLCGIANMNFDLSQFNNTLLGSQSNTVFGVAYFISMTDANNHINLLPINYSLPLGVNTFYAKVYNLVNPSCYALTPFTVTLYQQPIANTQNTIFICDDVSNDGVGNFNFLNTTLSVLGTQNSSQFAVSYHLNQNDADTNSNPLPLNYQNISNPQTVYIRIENNLNTNCFATTFFQIGLYKQPIANLIQDLFLCDDVSNDGIELFDLSVQNTTVLGTQLATDFNISYHLTSGDATIGSNALNSNFTNTSNPQTLYVRIENKLSKICYNVASFDLIVQPKPQILMDDTYTICEGTPINITAPSGFSSYSWSNGSMSPLTTIGQAGDYTLTVTQDYGDIICSDTKVITLLNSNIATITSIETLDWTDTENSITIAVTGDGDYEYSIDGIHYQDSPVFYGLRSGEYSIYVNDKKGCGIAIKEVFLLMYPKFFTPNGDGINDYWQIKFSTVEPNMQLILFDRYGKFINNFTGLDLGWDGTYNGQLLPSDDYWFVVKRQNGKEYKGHFAMKR